MAWHICEVTKRDLRLIRDSDGWAVAQAVQPANSRACHIDADANARLIAAAPELLAALEELERVESSPHSETIRYLARERARAAIDMVKGN